MGIYRHVNARFRIEGDLEKIRNKIQALKEWEDMLSSVWSKRLRKQFEEGE